VSVPAPPLRLGISLIFFCLQIISLFVGLFVCFFRFRIAGSAVVLATLVYPPVLANTHLGRKKKDTTRRQRYHRHIIVSKRRISKKIDSCFFFQYE